MSTINKCNIGGHDFYYEEVYFGPKGGASVFAIKDEADAKKFDLYWVVIPIKGDWEKGISNPKDGHVVCMCQNEIDAKMIAASINISHGLSIGLVKDGDLEKFFKSKFKSLEDAYDIDAMSKEISRLRREGKSDAEILDIMKSKRESFRRKKPTETEKDGGEW